LFGKKILYKNMKKNITVKVPATSANLGPGFDCLGAALGLYNTFRVSLDAKRECSEIVVKGCGKGVIPENGKNIVFRVIKDLFKENGKNLPSIKLEIVNNIPVARGLGSSSSAIVGGLCLANELLGRKYRDEELIRKAVDIEGHADNVVPAFKGGLCITRVENGGVPWWKLRVSSDLCACVCMPEFPVMTKKARELMPLKYSRKTSVFTTSGAAFFVSAVTSKCSKERNYIIEKAMEDKFHQPHRKKLVKGMEQVFEAGKKSGALGVALSGSGPSIIAIAIKNTNVEAIGSAMTKAFNWSGVASGYKILNFISNGAIIS